MLENSHSWMGASTSSIADSYQYQLQSMWQKCWNTNQNLMHHLRFRERGPLKSWRPETMAEAIFSVLKEGLSLSQAARKYDIPYPTFVLYANRVHNMLGPSIDGGPDLRPKGRGRPQRILLGIWPDEHIKGVIKTVVFRDAKDIKDEGLTHLPYGRHSPVFPFQEGHLGGYGGGGVGGGVGGVGVGSVGVGGPCPNGMPTPTGDQMSQEATAAAVAAVAHNLRQQMQMAAVVQHQQQQQHQHPEPVGPGPSIFNLPPHLQPHLAATAASGGGGGTLSGPGGIPLPKTNLSAAANSGASPASAMLGTRHAQSACGSGMPGIPNLPHGMAAALHGGPSAAMLSQQQQHQLQQLHLQQQHALHQQHQHQLKQQTPAHMAFLASTAASTPSGASSSSVALHRHQQQQQQHQQQQQLAGSASTHPSSSASPASTSSLQQKSSTSTIHTEHRRGSPPSITPLHSPLTELGLDTGGPVGISGMAYKPSRGYSSPRGDHLFQEDIADLVGSNVATSSNSAAATATNVASSTTITATSSTTAGTIDAAAVSATSSSSIKIEPLVMSSE